MLSLLLLPVLDLVVVLGEVGAGVGGGGRVRVEVGMMGHHQGVRRKGLCLTMGRTETILLI